MERGRRDVVFGTLEGPTRPRPNIEYPGCTLKCVTSLRPNNVKNPEEESPPREEESAPTQGEDADSGEEGELDRKGAVGDTTRGNKEEPSLDHLGEKVGQAAAGALQKTR
ncbi:hypothetical protein NDU88_004481 [Pleurodeles waltl]|uniref:Uncharacterized protein n=1 Tax=Pleurodeles waltl TaxID=8319 RepID=A0AAV7MGQ8_PLEWA|nr:hypothetical protein NDU88_004481 [Pleurodeles waltl]